MTRTLFAALALALVSAVPARADADTAPTLPTVSRPSVPLAFEANVGQTDPRARFATRADHMALFLGATGAVLSLDADGAGPEQPSAVQLTFVAASRDVLVEGVDRQPGPAHHYRGRDPRGWHTNVPQFARVRYSRLWPGIDAVFYGKGRDVEFDFVVAPGADLGHIALEVSGVEPSGAPPLRLDEHGNLLVGVAGDRPVVLKRPVIYQVDGDGRRQGVSGGYAIHGQRIHFDVGAHDVRRELVIDPVLEYSTYFGPATFDITGSPIAVDSSGSVYLSGSTTSLTFPTTGTLNPGVGVGNGITDLFIMKLTPDGTDIVYSVYFGGSGHDDARSLALDAAGAVYVVGYTTSADLPLTAGVVGPTFDPTFGAYSFVVKLDPTGGLESSTFLTPYPGGYHHFLQGDGMALAIDSSGSAYVAESAAGLLEPTPGAYAPRTPDCAQPMVTKLNPAATVLAYRTYFGTCGSVGGIAVDATGAVYLTGNATALPTTPGALMGSPSGDGVFALKLNPAGTSLDYSALLGYISTYWGARSAIAVDPSGSAYVTGVMQGTQLPVSTDAFQSQHFLPIGTFGNPQAAFVMKLTPDGGGLSYFTYLGTGFPGGNSPGYKSDTPTDIAVDELGSALVAGYTASEDFPITVDALVRTPQDDNSCEIPVGFISKLSPNGSSLLYSSFLAGGPRDYCGFNSHWAGGVALGPSGAVYVAGVAPPGFPTTPGALQEDPPQGDFFTPFVLKLSGLATVPGPLSVRPQNQDDIWLPRNSVEITFPANARWGQTTLASEYDPTPLPSNFAIGDPPTVFELTTTVSFTGEALVCVSYGGTALAGQPDVRMLHYEDGAWADVTTSLDAATQTVCGSVTSFSPFALALRQPPVLGIVPGGLSFGDTSIGAAAPSGTVTLSNDGGAPLMLHSIEATGNYTAVSSCPGSLDAGESCAVSVGFTPSGPGVRNGSLRVTHNAEGGMTTIGLTGTGTYTFGGFLPPLLDDGSASVRQGQHGRTIPVKFALWAGDGPASTALATLGVYRVLDVATGTTDATDLTADAGASSDTGNRFRLDGPHYVYNLSTRGFSAPATYRIVVRLDDGTEHMTEFSLK
jgi:hypothetical protein